MYVHVYIESTFLSPLSTCSMLITHWNYSSIVLAIYVPVFPGVSLMGGASPVVGGVQCW